MDFSVITINYFLEQLVEWIFEFYLIAFFTCFKIEKKKNFIFKFIIGLIIILAAAYGLSIILYLYGSIAIVRTLVYFALFSLAVVHFCFCYNENKSRILLFLDVSYLIQNLIYEIISISINSLIHFEAYGNGGPSAWQYKLTYYLFFFALFVLAFLFVIREIRKQFSRKFLSLFIIVFSLGTVIISDFLCSTVDVYASIISDFVPPAGVEHIYFLKLTVDFFSILLDTAVLIMFYAYARRLKLDSDINQMKYVIAKSEEQYKISKETIENINIKCHDMKHRINMIVGNNLDKETIDELNESIYVYDSLVDTGNKIIDVILAEKSLICESNHITFTKMVDGKALLSFTTGDIFCLLGNILDNAIEASLKIKDVSKRYINLVIKKEHENIINIECFNYYEDKIEFEKNFPKTHKKDSINHGFGVKSIENIAKKYGGKMNINIDNNIFDIHIVLFDELPNK